MKRNRLALAISLLLAYPGAPHGRLSLEAWNLIAAWNSSGALQ